MKKKAPKKIIKKKVSGHSVLNEALSDISKELNKLRKDKEAISKKLDVSDQEIVRIQNIESELRDRISKLVSKESLLNKTKGASQSKLLELKQKIAKIKKVQEELRDV